jgi:hypothetical protein
MVSDMPALPTSSTSQHECLSENLIFGAHTPPDPSADVVDLSMLQGPSARKGHYHNHMLSHNFFSLLEPGPEAAHR